MTCTGTFAGDDRQYRTSRHNRKPAVESRFGV